MASFKQLSLSLSIIDIYIYIYTYRFVPCTILAIQAWVTFSSHLTPRGARQPHPQQQRHAQLAQQPPAFAHGWRQHRTGVRSNSTALTAA